MLPCRNCKRVEGFLHFNCRGILQGFERSGNRRRLCAPQLLPESAVAACPSTSCMPGYTLPTSFVFLAGIGSLGSRQSPCSVQRGRCPIAMLPEQDLRGPPETSFSRTETAETCTKSVTMRRRKRSDYIVNNYIYIVACMCQKLGCESAWWSRTGRLKMCTPDPRGCP